MVNNQFRELVNNVRATDPLADHDLRVNGETGVTGRNVAKNYIKGFKETQLDLWKKLISYLDPENPRSLQELFRYTEKYQSSNLEYGVLMLAPEQTSLNTATIPNAVADPRAATKASVGTYTASGRRFRELTQPRQPYAPRSHRREPEVFSMQATQPQQTETRASTIAARCCLQGEPILCAKCITFGHWGPECPNTVAVNSSPDLVRWVQLFNSLPPLCNPSTLARSMLLPMRENTPGSGLP